MLVKLLLPKHAYISHFTITITMVMMTFTIVSTLIKTHKSNSSFLCLIGILIIMVLTVMILLIITVHLNNNLKVITEPSFNLEQKCLSVKLSKNV